MNTAEKKYYIPNINEFFVGLQYEQHVSTHGGVSIMDFENNTVEHIKEPSLKVWNKYKFSIGVIGLDNNLEQINQLLKSNRIRIRYINQSDIESLGFKHIKGSKTWFMQTGWTESLEISLVKPYTFLIEYVDQTNEYTESTTVFRGKIKNKSELERILKLIK